jgi:hypothetical protein
MERKTRLLIGIIGLLLGAGAILSGIATLNKVLVIFGILLLLSFLGGLRGTGTPPQ